MKEVLSRVRSEDPVKGIWSPHQETVFFLRWNGLKSDLKPFLKDIYRGDV